MEKYVGQIARGKEILRLCLDRKRDDPFYRLIQSAPLCIAHTQIRQSESAGLLLILRSNTVTLNMGISCKRIPKESQS